MPLKVKQEYKYLYPSEIANYIGLSINDLWILEFIDEQRTRIYITEEVVMERFTAY